MIHRTLLITSFFPPNVGGTERYVENIARNLPSNRLVVVAPPAPGDRAFDSSLPSTVIRKDLLQRSHIRPGWLKHLAWIMSLIRKERITRLVFGHYAGFVGLGLAAKMMLGIPYVLIFHGLDFYSYRSNLVRRTLLRLNLRGAEWVIANSSFTLQLLNEFGVPRGKTLIAAPGIAQRATPTKDEVRSFRSRYHLQSQPMLLTVGRLVPRKGQIRVIRALPEVRSRFPNVSYVIVGSGPFEEEIKRTANNFGVSDSVRVLGNLSDREVNLAYHAADAFIMLPSSASRDPEGFGMVFAEALQAKKPLVATASGGTVDIVGHENFGMMLDEHAGRHDVATAIARLFSDPGRMRRMGEAGAAYVAKRFSIEAQVRPLTIMLTRPERERNEPPAVSIIIPIWNGAHLLSKTLHRVFLQTSQDLEVLVVDDGSHDHPQQVCARFPSVKLISQAHRGAPAARNRGFAESRGRFLLFCDSDVSLHPRMVERLVTTLELNPNASYAYCSFRFGWRTFDLFDFDRQRLKQSNYISMMSLIRRETFPGFDETLPRLQDWDVWLTMLERGQSGVWVPARLFSVSAGKRGISKNITAPPADIVRRVKDKHGLV